MIECQLNGGDFAALVTHAQTMTPRRVTIPVVGHLLLTMREGALQVAGTDLDRTLTMMAPAAGSGSLTASADKLAALASKLSGKQDVRLSFDEQGSRLVIVQGSIRMRLATLPAGDFPLPLTEPLTDAPTWTVASDIIAQRLRVLESTIDTGDPRATLHGARFDFAADRMIATDGYRLAVQPLAGLNPPPADSFPSFTMPVQLFRTVYEMAKRSPKLTIALTDSSMSIEAGDNMRLRSRLIIGDYPPWSRAVPPGCERRVAFDIADMRRALDTVGIVDELVIESSKTKFGIAADLFITADAIRISTHNSQLGQEIEDSIPASCPAAGDDTIRRQFNVKWLVGALASFGDKGPVELELPPGPVDATALHLATNGADDRAAYWVIAPRQYDGAVKPQAAAA